jgi:hypothetical protein
VRKDTRKYQTSSESFLSCTFLPVSKACTNKLCILRQCKYIKEEKLIPIFWTSENILSRPEVKRKQCGGDRYYANIRA